MLRKERRIIKRGDVLMDVDAINEGMNSLIRTGYYESRDKLLDDGYMFPLDIFRSYIRKILNYVLKGGRDNDQNGRSHI